ncbi:MAG TPA: hypothetical protein VLS27_07655 [Gammaproteobacteria bacterium]|nr:hypothetical protein [Gammaproteobacteria bacterium]
MEAFIAAVEDGRESDAETLLQRIRAHERDWKKARKTCAEDPGPLRALLDADVAKTYDEMLWSFDPPIAIPPDLIGGAG